MSEKYIEAVFQAGTEEYELASYFLTEAGCLGIEDLQETDEAKLGRAFFAGDSANEATELINQALAPISGAKLETIEVKESKNWFAERRIHFPPIHAADGIVILPEWEDEQPGKINVRIRPGMAFGTGNHETTQIALRLIAQTTKEVGPQAFIEIGIGSGVLSIAAIKLGNSYIGACDIQPESPEETAFNFQLSGLDKAPEVFLGGTEGLTNEAQLLIANMTADELMPLKDEFLRLTVDNARLIFCGVDDGGLARFKAAFADSFLFLSHAEENGWHGFIAKKKN